MSQGITQNSLHILVVSEVRNFYTKIMKERLELQKYIVSFIGANIDDIHKFQKKTGAVIIYADEKLVSQNNALVFLKDKAVEEDIPVFIIGDHDELRKVTALMPRKLICGAFARPIDILNVIAKVVQTVEKNFQHKRILVVDDSGPMLRSVKEWLEDKYSVYLANSGAMAIKCIAVNKPDLVLLDYDMPICDGKTVLEMIRAEMEFKEVPVIFLTNMDSEESVRSVQYLSPSRYLLKTMGPSKIVSEINDFFVRQKGLG